MDTAVNKISDMEAEIMKVVWKKTTPITYAEIRAGLSQKFNMESQSIQSMVKRLVQKGALRQEKKDVYYYTALVPEADYIQAKTKSLLSKVFDGNAKELLTALIAYDEITPEDLDELREFWRKGGKENE